MITPTLSCSTRWRGVPANKHPVDSWVYQEILHDLKPEIVIELGNQYGGTTLMLADLQAYHGGSVIAVDIDHSQINPKVFGAPNIVWIEGDAASDEVYSQCALLANGHRRVLVIEDTMHTIEHTYALLKMYSQLVTKDSYYIVEDTDTEHTLCFYPSRERTLTAVERFLAEDDRFFMDRDAEKFWLTFHPGGFLRRVK